MTQPARSAIAGPAPVNLKLNLPRSVATVRTLPSRMASTTGSVLASGTKMPWGSTVFAVDKIGAFLSTVSATSVLSPTFSFQPSS